MTGHCHAVISWQESPGGRVTVRCDCAAYTPAPAETDWSRCGYSVDCLRTPAVALALPDGQPKPYCTEHANSVRKFALKDVPRSLA